MSYASHKSRIFVAAGGTDGERALSGGGLAVR